MRWYSACNFWVGFA